MKYLTILLLGCLFGCAQVPVIDTPIGEPLNAKASLSEGEGYLVMGYYGMQDTTLYLRSVEQEDTGFKELHREHHEYSIKNDDPFDFVIAKIPEGSYFVSLISHKPSVGYAYTFSGVSSRIMRIEIQAGKVNYAGIVGVALDGMTLNTRFYTYDNMIHDRRFISKTSPSIASLEWVDFDLCGADRVTNDHCVDVTNRYSNIRYFLRYISRKYQHYGDPIKNTYTSEMLGSLGKTGAADNNLQ